MTNTNIKNNPEIEVYVANNLNDFHKIIALRAMIFCGEENISYNDEFSINELCCTYIIGTVNNEPAGLIRIHEFQGFAKFERIAVLQKFRKTGLADVIVDKAINLCAQKGINNIYLLCKEELYSHWQQRGYEKIENAETVNQSGLTLIPIMAKIPEYSNTVTINSHPNMLNQQEGEWDEYSKKLNQTKIFITNKNILKHIP